MYLSDLPLLNIITSFISLALLLLLPPKPECPHLQVPVIIEVIHLFNVCAHAFSISTFLKVIINEAFEFDLNVDTRVVLLQFVLPVLQSHDLIEAVDVTGELIETGRHEPL